MPSLHRSLVLGKAYWWAWMLFDSSNAIGEWTLQGEGR